MTTPECTFSETNGRLGAWERFVSDSDTIENGQESGINASFADPVGEVRRVANQALATIDVDGMTDAELAMDLVRLRRQADRIESVLTEMSTKARRRGSRGRRVSPAAR